MRDSLNLIAVDLGTSSLKACLYSLGERLELLASTSRELSLSTDADGRAEQDPEEWWRALASSLPELLRAARLGPGQIEGLTFCAQMQCLVLVDKDGRALRPAQSYLDSRASERRRRLTAAGPRIAGIGVGLLLPWLDVAGGVAASAKDPLWKYLRVEDEEPEVIAHTAAWLDAKDYLTARCTGHFTMSVDSAFATFLADTRHGRVEWSPWLVRRFGVNPAHLPKILAPSDRVGLRGRGRCLPHRRGGGGHRPWEHPCLRGHERLGIHGGRPPHRRS